MVHGHYYIMLFNASMYTDMNGEISEKHADPWASMVLCNAEIPFPTKMVYE